MSILVKFLAALVLTVSRAYVAMVLWFWFAVPLGLRPIGFWHAMGLGSIVFVFTTKIVESHKEVGEVKSTREIVSELIASAILLPLILLGLGWLYLQAM